MSVQINGDTGVNPIGAATGVGFTPTGNIAATNVQAAIAELDSEKAPVSAGVPAGAVMDFAMNAVPSGWLACNGATVSRTTYAALFAAIGTTWGAGDGSTTFKLPDTRGRYRASAGTDGTAATKTFGQYLGDAIRNISGTVGALFRAANIGTTGAMTAAAYGSTPPKAGVEGADAGDSATIGINASLQVPTDVENRPYSVVMLTCIKI